MKRNSNRSTGRVALTVSIVLALAVLLGAMLGVGGFATETVRLPDVSATANDEGGKYLDIYAANVDYEEYLHIWYAVSYDFGELELDAKDVKMAFWYAPQSAYTKDNAAYTATGAQKTTVTPAGGKTVEVVILHSDDIPAAHMVDNIYARAYIENGDEVYYSEVLKYSVVQYVQDRFLDAEADSSSVTNAQRNLYEQTLEYGANAQKVLGYKTDRLANAAYVYLTLANGITSDGSDTALLLPGERVDVHAVVKDSFTAWYSKDGGKLVEKTSYTYVAPKTDANMTDVVYASSLGSSKHPTNLAKGDSELYITGNYDKYGIVFVDIKGDGNVVQAINSKKYASTGHGITVKSLNSKSESSVGMVYEFDIQVNGVSKETANLMEWDIGTDHRTYFNLSEGQLVFAHYNRENNTNAKFDATFEVGEWLHIRTEYHFGELPAVTKDGTIDYAEGTDADDYFYVITYVNDTPVVISSYNYEAIKGGNNTLRVYSYGTSGADYEYTIANVKFSYVDEVATVTEALAENPGIRCKTLAIIHEQWLDTELAVRKIPGLTEDEISDIMDALRDFVDLYAHEGSEVWRWIANLYDPETGGFYYSNSARDTYGYLPDVESTGQVKTILQNLGITAGGDQAFASDAARAKVTSWIMSLQSNHDGYLYHPQWGTDVSTSRRSRDYNKLTASPLFDNVAERANGNGIEGIATVIPYKAADAKGVAYEIPTVRLQRDAVAMVSLVIPASDSNTNTGLTGHLKNVETFKEYLNNVWNSNNSYSFGHIISSQSGQIKLSKELVVACIEFMDQKQEEIQKQRSKNGLEPNGLWEYENSYRAINGLLKISGAYNALADAYKAYCEKDGKIYNGLGKINYAEHALKSAVEAMLADPDSTDSKWEMSAVVNVYNPPHAIINVFDSLEAHYVDALGVPNQQELIDELYAYIQEHTYEIIVATNAKVAKFLKEDAAGNSFSYGVDSSAGTSQGELAAVPNTAEGDVNGTSLAISTRKAMLEVLRIPYVDITTASYRSEYYEILNRKTEAAVKKSYYADADADTTITFDKDADAPKPSNSSVTATIVDGTLKFNESNTSGGGGITFSAINKFSADGKIKYLVSGDFKFTKNKVGTQIFLHNGAGSNIFRIDVSSANSGDTLVLKYHYYSDGASGDNPDKSFEVARVDADKWFNIAIEMYPELYDGANATAATAFLKVTVKQEGKDDQVKDIAQAYKNTADLTSFTELYLYGLKTSVTECYIDNLVCECYGVSDDDGVYYFDTLYVPNGKGNEMVAEPGKTNGNNVLKIADAETFQALTLHGNKDNAYNNQINYNSLETRVIVDSYAAGEVFKLAMLDSESNSIFCVTASINSDGKLTFTDANNNKLIKNLKVANKVGDKFELTVKLYYYADSERADLVVRYNDVSANATTYPGGKSTAVAATVSGVSADLIDGISEDYTAAKISVNKGTVIYVDDVFVRNYIPVPEKQ